MHRKRLYEWDLERVFEVISVQEVAEQPGLAKCVVKPIKGWLAKSVSFRISMGSTEYRTLSEWPYIYIADDGRFKPVEKRGREFSRIENPSTEPVVLFRV